ncbi:MAG: hypothetical protein EXR72_21085 [Myxococcales bacterium]|nr:hypothetical protein [Myxococcales bacterium]
MVATVDEVHAQVIDEAFADAGIEVELLAVKSGFVHQPYFRVQTYADMRPMIDVEVDPERAEEAGTLLAQLSVGAQENLDAAALAEEPPADAGSRLPALIARVRGTATAVVAVYLVLSIVLPLLLFVFLWLW